MKFSRSYSKKGLIVCAVALLSACAPVVKVAVEERTVLTVRQQSELIGGRLIRIAQSGDTLFAIAFESNLNVNQLAAWNDIKDTSRLLVGQRVRLTKPIGFVPKRVVRERPAEVSLQAKVKPQANKASGLKATRSSSVSSAKPSSSAKSNRNPKKNITHEPVVSNSSVWSWPLRGAVIRHFSPASTQQGIDILGKGGESVRASASGEVVYVGDSLKGYGNLIIIKHNETFLSAYAHNRNILVKEGQGVSSNELIGSVGINNRKESALHFQIRRKGKPVNPLSFLPAI